MSTREQRAQRRAQVQLMEDAANLRASTPPPSDTHRVRSEDAMHETPENSVENLASRSRTIVNDDSMCPPTMTDYVPIQQLYTDPIQRQSSYYNTYKRKFDDVIDTITQIDLLDSISSDDLNRRKNLIEQKKHIEDMLDSIDRDMSRTKRKTVTVPKSTDSTGKYSPMYPPFNKG